MTEAERKRRAALEAAGAAPLVVRRFEVLTRTPEFAELETGGDCAVVRL
jgi:hypothetical protein